MSGPLQHTPSDIIRQLLVDVGQGEEETDDPTVDWQTFFDNVPDEPHNVIVVIGQEGVLHGRAQVTGRKFLHHGFQIYLRATDKLIGSKKAYELAVYLDEQLPARYEVTLPAVVGTDDRTYRIQSVNRQGDVIYIGEEEASSARHEFSINCLAAIRDTEELS